MNGLTLSLLETLESGSPFGANNINNSRLQRCRPAPYVTIPGYLDAARRHDRPTTSITVDCSNVPAAVTSRRFWLHERQPARRLPTRGTEAHWTCRPTTRTVSEAPAAWNVFVKGTIINLFDQSQLCGCGGTIFENGGGVWQTRIDQTVRTAVSHPALYQPFNPFTQAPVQGMNWNYGPNFGTALNRFAYTTPRHVQHDVRRAVLGRSAKTTVRRRAERPALGRRV